MSKTMISLLRPQNCAYRTGVGCGERLPDGVEKEARLSGADWQNLPYLHSKFSFRLDIKTIVDWYSEIHYTYKSG